VKKPGAFILLFLYLDFSVGLTLHHHYCMGDYTGSSLFSRGDACDQCGMEEKSDCCSEKQTYLKITDDQQNSSFYYSGDPLQFSINYHEPGFQLNPIISYIILIDDHGPPGRSSIPLFLKNMNFRI
jgi:hypothetical protein